MGYSGERWEGDSVIVEMVVDLCLLLSLLQMIGTMYFLSDEENSVWQVRAIVEYAVNACLSKGLVALTGFGNIGWLVDLCWVS